MRVARGTQTQFLLLYCWTCHNIIDCQRSELLRLPFAAVAVAVVASAAVAVAVVAAAAVAVAVVAAAAVAVVPGG